MSFRNRLALFFVLMVIVPMLAVAFLLFRLIDRSASGKAGAAIAQKQDAARNLFDESRSLANAALDEVSGDEAFTEALREGRDIKRAQARAKALREHRGIQRIVFVRGGSVVLDTGSRRAIASARRDVQVDAPSGAARDLGRLEVSVTDAAQFVALAHRVTGLQVAVLNGGKVLASTLPRSDARLPSAADGETLELAGREYRVDSFTDPGAFSGQQIRIVTLGSLSFSSSGDKTFTAIILLGFFIVAIASATLVSRTLQQQIAAFLNAARKLAGGDFSAQVPTIGRDEFAALGEEFNKMSRELERRLAELAQERGRVQDSMRRLGEAVASNLDRDALLELVVQTAVEGVGADAGRACVRTHGGTLEERSRVGRVHALERALHGVETDALRLGGAHEATVGEAFAIAHPLRGADGRNEIVGVVSLARDGRPFTPSERDLFSYLAGQVARSMENVELHETTARQSVTDELTGLANRRAFDDALSGEIERSRRFGSELGLVLIDLDDFKVVNDTYGHPQGDLVLREVARVLRGGSREIDYPARYGGEELAVVLPGTDLEGAFNRAERIREQIAALRIARLDGNGTLGITASCGVASVRATTADGRALLQAADSALYEAKRGGKNKSVRAR